VSDSYNLSRFIKAQDGVYLSVIEELKRGRKTSHWIWYVFPQIAGLGHSQMSQQYAISSINEAKAYAEHPVLGPRLIECVELVMAMDGKSAEQIFGHIDALKFCFCLTLCSAANKDNGIFHQVLDKCFDGVPDTLTIRALQE
jgi:uncharacterized protein (DUF1810 family)